MKHVVLGRRPKWKEALGKQPGAGLESVFGRPEA